MPFILIFKKNLHNANKCLSLFFDKLRIMSKLFKTILDN